MSPFCEGRMEETELRRLVHEELRKILAGEADWLTPAEYRDLWRLTDSTWRRLSEDGAVAGGTMEGTAGTGRHQKIHRDWNPWTRNLGTKNRL